MLRDIIEATVGLAWVSLCLASSWLSVQMLSQWIGSRSDARAVFIGVVWLLWFIWSTAVTPAVVAFTLG